MIKRNQGLNDIAKEIFANSNKKGFYDEPMNLHEKLLLVISEVVETMEADRDDNYFKDIKVNDPEPDFDTNPTDWKLWFKSYIKDTYEDELADVIIRTLDHFAAIGANADYHVTRKMQYNSLRPHKHGKKY